MIQVIALLVIVGVALYFLPMDSRVKSVIYAILGLFVFVWLLQAFGLWHGPALR